MAQKKHTPPETFIAHAMRSIGRNIEDDWGRNPELAGRNPYSGYSIGLCIADNVSPGVKYATPLTTRFMKGVTVPSSSHPMIPLVAESTGLSQPVVLALLERDRLATDVEAAKRDPKRPAGEVKRLKALLKEYEDWVGQFVDGPFLSRPLEVRPRSDTKGA